MNYLQMHGSQDGGAVQFQLSIVPVHMNKSGASHIISNAIAKTLISVLVCLSIFISCNSSDKTDRMDGIKVSVMSERGQERILHGWVNGDTVVFVAPSFAKEENVRFISENKGFVVPDTLVFGEYYEIHKGRIKFFVVCKKSESVPTAFIDTETGTCDYLHAAKGNKESCDLNIIDSNDVLLFASNDMPCVIKTRGNSTWWEEKKPYLLKTEKRTELLGMQPAKKWVFLANAFDESNLRNKIVYDFARQLGHGWVPDSRYVDLFMNNQYKGLYLITEKVEVDRSRLFFADCDSIYMFHMTSEFQMRHESNCFVTKKGQRIVVDYPKSFADTSLSYVKELVQNIEDVILEDQGAEDLADIIDVDSWAFKYLIDDVFENTDCDFLSSYFYVVFHDGHMKCYGGPIWDFDLGIGNNLFNYEPDMFFARRIWKSLKEYTPYYNALLERPSFYRTVVDLYEEEIRPSLADFLDEDLILLYNGISISSSLNSERFKHGFVEVQKKRHTSKSREAKELIDHLRKRLVVLDSCYLGSEDRFLVSYEITERSGYYRYKMLPYGEKVGTLCTSDSLNGEKVRWKEKGTEEEFDFNTVVDRDLVLDIIK